MDTLNVRFRVVINSIVTNICHFLFYSIYCLTKEAFQFVHWGLFYVKTLMPDSIEFASKTSGDFLHFMCSCSDIASLLRKQLLFWLIQSSETNHSATVNTHVFCTLLSIKTFRPKPAFRCNHLLLQVIFSTKKISDVAITNSLSKLLIYVWP